MWSPSLFLHIRESRPGRLTSYMRVSIQTDSRKEAGTGKNKGLTITRVVILISCVELYSFNSVLL